MIISFTSEKGGVGKSTNAINLAAALANKGSDVCLVDADKQQTVSSWISHRNSAIENGSSLFEIHSVQKLDNIKSALIDLNKRYEFVIVDCAGRDSKEMRSALVVSDISVIPLKCSQADYETLTNMQQMVENAKMVNDRLAVYVLRSIASTNPAVKEEIELKEGIESYYPDFPVLDSIIRERKAFRDSYAEGKAIWELKNQNTKAIEEFNFFVEELLNGDQTTSI